MVWVGSERIDSGFCCVLDVECGEGGVVDGRVRVCFLVC